MKKLRVFRFLSALLILVLLLCCAPLRPEASAEGTLSLTPEEQALVDSGRTLQVGYVQDRIPVSFSDGSGELAGISRYIFDRMEQISGLDFEYVPLPAGDVTYAYLMEQGFDLVTSVEFNKANLGARGILMSQPYFTSRKVVVARRDFNSSLDSALSVALCSGSQTIKKVLAETYPNYTVVDYDSIGACFHAVDKGEADMMILSQYVVEYWLHKPAYENLKVIPILGVDEQLCFSAVVPYDAEGNPADPEGYALISVLDKAIEQLRPDEVDNYTIQAIMENRYTYNAADFAYRYRYAIAVFVVSVLLISAMAVLLMRQRLQSVKAQADARARSQFLSTMSHEIRTPLNGLIVLNYLMSHKLHDQEQLARYLEQSTTTANYLLSLVSDILDMSMLHNEDVKIELKPVNLQALLSTVEAIIQSAMADKQLNFKMEARLIQPCILGDGVRIQQILLNLLDNARKFTPEGGSVGVLVEQTAGENGRVNTRMEVSDTGRGMSKAFQENIFDAFAQERDTVSKGDEGVGLGLSICHRLAKLMGGEVSFHSEVGKGSVFVFSFSAEPALPPAECPDEAPVSTGAKPKVLVAEDNELNGEIMLELLEENDFPAELVTDGRAALESFSDSEVGEFGVILMDLLMPRMDGFAAAAAIRALDRPDAKTVRILACSANCTVEDREKAKASGMDDFLSKPVNIRALLEKLSS